VLMRLLKQLQFRDNDPIEIAVGSVAPAGLISCLEKCGYRCSRSWLTKQGGVP
jgi:hypothetical protein